MDPERIEAFLADLTALTEKYQIAIWGCGCDGSPWIAELEPSERDGHFYATGQWHGDEADHLRWVDAAEFASDRKCRPRLSR